MPFSRCLWPIGKPGEHQGVAALGRQLPVVRPVVPGQGRQVEAEDVVAGTSRCEVETLVLVLTDVQGSTRVWQDAPGSVGLCLREVGDRQWASAGATMAIYYPLHRVGELGDHDAAHPCRQRRAALVTGLVELTVSWIRAGARFCGW